MNDNRQESSELLSLHKIGKTFKNGDRSICILDGIDLSIAVGESVAVTGKSGSGKSTLLNIAGTLDRPTTGTVMFKGENLSIADDVRLSLFRNIHIGFIFQSHLLLDDFTALENVCVPAMIAGLTMNKAKPRATMLLERVGLADRLGQSPLKLSGGERQRVAICRALMNNPDLLIADEPTGSLDEQASAQVADILFSLVQEEQKALLLVTHDRQTAKGCSAAYLLHNRILEPLA